MKRFPVGLWRGDYPIFPCSIKCDELYGIVGEHRMIVPAYDKGMGKYRPYYQLFFLILSIDFIATNEINIDPSWEKYLRKEKRCPVYQWKGKEWHELKPGFSKE